MFFFVFLFLFFFFYVSYTSHTSFGKSVSIFRLAFLFWKRPPAVLGTESGLCRVFARARSYQKQGAWDSPRTPSSGTHVAGGMVALWELIEARERWLSRGISDPSEPTAFCVADTPRGSSPLASASGRKVRPRNEKRVAWSAPSPHFRPARSPLWEHKT